MNPFRFITRVFIDVFGITHPDAREERRAAWFICSLLGLVVAVIALILFGFYQYGHH